ncbi:MAG TPA: hypothetical protein VIF09_12535, partial [Polyangiaceae bacterium]
EQQIQAFPSAWTQVASDLSSISAAIGVANLAVTAANLNEKSAEGALALNEIQVQGAMTQAVAQFMQTVAGAVGGAIGSLGLSTFQIPVAAMALENSEITGAQELNAIQSLANTAQQIEDNQLAQALAQLGTTTGPLWADVQKQVDNLRGAVAAVDASGQTIAQTGNQAAYQLAVGTGQDFVSVAGQEVPIPVDTVLRRQSSATLQRYQAALTNAKALAYMARRAIEERIGVPLDSITQQVGPVDAPASWADSICSLQGVNYASLSTATPGNVDGGGIGGALDQRAISQFADAWVGDYVAKLQNFVTYYNVQYPSHQGEDDAVLSLRFDLLGPTAQCMTQAPNLLTNAGDLSQFSPSSWQLGPCNGQAQKCLAVIGGYGLPPPQSGPWGAQGMGADAGALSSENSSGVTWLLDVPVPIVDAGAPSEAGDAGADGAGADGGGADAGSSGLPNNLVVQEVPLAAGSYVLSWWDQARDANGNIVWAGGITQDGGTTAVPNYVAEIFDGSWNAIAVADQPPYMPPQVGAGGQPSLWSGRRVLSFTIENAGTYAVAFGASTLAEKPGSVAIADVQLELAANGQPSTYVGTTDSTTV